MLTNVTPGLVSDLTSACLTSTNPLPTTPWPWFACAWYVDPDINVDDDDDVVDDVDDDAEERGVTTNVQVPEEADPARSFRLDGRRVVVTGASSGLGARFARVAARAGAEVLAVARRADRLAALAAADSRIVAFPCDITDADDVARLDDAIAARGGVDVLVNNAGASGNAEPHDEPMEHFLAVLDVNLVGMYRVTQVAARHMLAAGRGSIVNVASIFGQVASAPIKQPGYCAAKGGVVNLTRELAVSWARKGIRVNAISPGFFPSEITEHMWGNTDTVAFINRNTPLGRAGREHELDGALLFLASDASSFVTGQVLAVDGGWTAR